MTAQIPLFAFPQDTALELALRDAAERVLASRRFVLDREVKAFEEEFAAACGASHCVGVANGTDALELALRAVGVGPGDRVATVANAGFYACSAIAAIGATPMFVDVDSSLTMAPDAFAAVAGSVRALVVTHLYGRLAAIEALTAMASAAGVRVIEDCAHAHGAERNGRRAGAFGDAGCFSFYPTKNLGALGDGGAVVTSSDALRARLVSLRQYGWAAKYEVVRPGGRNSRLDELQAAFLRAKLPYLDRWNDARRAIAQHYVEALRDTSLALPDVSGGRGFIAHLFVVRSKARDTLMARLAADGIGCDVHYPISDHRQPAFAHTDVPSLPASEAACREVLSLPCHPGLGAADVRRVVEAVRRATGSER